MLVALATRERQPPIGLQIQVVQEEKGLKDRAQQETGNEILAQVG
jgi:hypothetical protein